MGKIFKRNEWFKTREEYTFLKNSIYNAEKSCKFKDFDLYFLQKN